MSNFSLLDLVAIHHDQVLQMAVGTEAAGQAQRIVESGNVVLEQALVPFEIAHRGYFEANAALLEMNQTLERLVSERTADLATSEARYRTMVETAQEGIWVVDIENRTIFANRRLAGMFGYAAEEMLGQSLFSFMDEPARAIAQAQMSHRQDGIGEQLDLQFKRRDGRDLWAIVSANPLLDADGRYTGTLAMVIDITARRQEQERLRISEQQLEEAERLAHLGHWSWDLATDQLGWSAEHCRIFGLEPRSGTIPAAEGLAMIHPDDRSRLDDLIERLVRDGSPYETDVRIVRPDRVQRVIESRGTLQRDVDGSAWRLVGTAQDVTERTLMQEVQARLAAIVQSSDDAIIGKTLDGIITSWNGGAERLYGYAAAEMVGQPIARLAPPELQDGVPAILARVREGERVLQHETVRVRKDGARIAVAITTSPILDETGAITGAATIARDLTASKESAEALERSEERFRLLVENIHEVLWMTDVAKGEVVYISPGYEAVWGRTCESLYTTPRDWIDAIHEADRDRVLHAALQQAKGGYDETYRIVRPDGAIRWIRDVAFPVHNASGNVTLVVGVAEDITERRSLEERFRQAQKMEAVGVLAGGIAHDFNNLLTAIIGFSELTLAELPLESPLRPMVDEVARAGERAAVLTRQLLAFSRQQVLQPEVVDLNAIVVDMERLLTRLIGEDIDLATIRVPDLGHVFADPSQLEQIIMNLVVNARDAMPGGGKLTITTANVDVVPTDGGAVQGPTARPHVLLAVGDSGIGMDAATAERIFEPFFTTKEQGKGTGLGLATVYGIVQQSGGEIRVSSELGKGTTFHVYLPRIAEEVAASRSATAASALACGTETIVLVEDEAAVRGLAIQILETAGYHLLVAGAGDRAYELVQEYPDRIDLLLTDVVMPGMNGVDLARRVKRLRPEMRVLFMSGYPGEVAAQHGLLAEADTYLGKPFTPTNLIQRVRDVLDAPVPDA
jgi:PAS domain S-box-containing protein